MWQTDTVTIQTSTEVNNFGVITKTWSPDHTVICDVQDVNKELAYKEWGFTDSVDYKQVFDHTQDAGWVKGNQVEYDGEQWLVRLVNRNMGKMAGSNHAFIILSAVV